MKHVLLAASLVLALSAAPVLAQAQAISASDKRQGAEADPQLIKQFGGAMKGRAADYVARVGRRIAVQSGLSDSERDFTVTLLDSPVENAFAIPGGYIYVTRGLLALTNDEAELASVLGHEVGHVAARHAAKRQQTATLTQVLAGVVGAVAGNSGVGSLLGKGAGFGADLINKGYSRGQEYQADDLGVAYLARAGYDPLASSDMLAVLGEDQALDARLNGQDNNVPSWMSTHPNSADRVRRARDKAEATGSARRGLRNRDALLDAIDGLPWGDDPSKGYVDGNEFKLPAQRLAFAVPPGFQVANSDEAVVISGAEGQASFSGGEVGKGGLDDYVDQVFGKLGKTIQHDQIRGGHARAIDFRYAFARVNSNAGALDVGVFAYRPDASSTAYHLLTLTRSGTGVGPFRSVVESMRRMSPAEAAAARPLRVHVIRVKTGDTPQSLAKQMAFPDDQVDRFLVLNDLSADAKLTVGDRVKIITRQ